MEPVWAPFRKELYYRDATGDKVMVVPYETKQINIVLNWSEELKQLVPTGNRNR